MIPRLVFKNKGRAVPFFPAIALGDVPITLGDAVVDGAEDFPGAYVDENLGFDVPGLEVGEDDAGAVELGVPGLEVGEDDAGAVRFDVPGL